MRQFVESRDALKKELSKLKKDDTKRKEEIERLLSRKICFVIDTVAKMVPRAEKEGEIGKKNFGLLAALMTQFMRVATSYIGDSDSNMTLILLNHERQNINKANLYSPDWVLGPGGESVNNFDQDVKLRVTTTSIKEDGVEIGKESTIKVHKCKIGINGGEAKFFIGNGKGSMPYGFDLAKDVAYEAINRGSSFVRKEGNTYYLFGEKVATGFESFVQYIRDNERAYDDMYSTLNQELRKG